MQEEVKIKGEEILKRIESQPKSSIFSKDFWYGSVMDWSMKNDTFKTNMFRFVDVLPTLSSSQEVTKHIKEYFSDGNGELPPVFNMGLGLGSLAPGLMSGAIKKNITQMAKMFIVGENPKEALDVLKKARKQKMTFTVDILGEATLSEKEAREYQSKYLELIEWLSQDADKWETSTLIDQDDKGLIPKINVSVKLTALYSQINDKDWDNTKTTLKDRLRPIFRLGVQKNVFINLDMEHYAVKSLTLEVFKELLLEPEIKNYPHFGCVIQAYLRDSYSDIKDLIEFARVRNTPFTIRLVKGAYWDYETIEAQQQGWPIPVYTHKPETDANYEQCAQLLLQSYPYIKTAIASHNVRTLAACLVYAEKIKVPKNSLEIQMLYGMADSIKKSLVDMDYRVREYAPIGDLLPGMAYLVRRLLENTSNESWLRGKFSDGKTTDDLLKDPSLDLQPSPEKSKSKNHFTNEPLLDFAEKKHRELLAAALIEKKKLLPFKILPRINGKEISTEQSLQQKNPSNNQQVVSIVHLSNGNLAETAIQSAHTAYLSWSKTPFEYRAQLLKRLADLMNKKRYSLISTQILEVGKPWAEADADIAEAIDFCKYYADDLLKIGRPQRVGNIPGELSYYSYKARGVTTVIAPWNFPLAIIAGMAAAALAAGNSVLLKPAEQSSLVAKELMDMILEVGFPSDLVQFLPGLGEVVGEYLVQHPLTTTIAFTGSKTVGLHILKSANTITKPQRHVKKCIIEMGGKNAMIIDNDADLDEAVSGVVYSAFGFSGQKCSACSRAIVLSEVYDRFKDRLVEAVKSITQSSAEDPKAYLGPVIDQESYERIQKTIEDAKRESTLLYQAPQAIGGYYVPPTIFSEVNPKSNLAQNEIFGPVLAIIKAQDLKEALEIANDTEYALTGGFFSRSPENIEHVRANFEVGNLYINRGITGAMVDRHPFGGFKMSGVGSKTGGPDYLKQFMEPVCITENTMRRGFAPAEED